MDICKGWTKTEKNQKQSGRNKEREYINSGNNKNVRIESLELEEQNRVKEEN